MEKYQQARTRRWLRTLSMTLAVPILLLGAVACGDDDSSSSGAEATGTSQKASEGPDRDEPVKIGMLLPQTGVFSQVAQETLEGFKLYLEQHDGTLGGRKIELIVDDDENNPEVGLRKAQKLVNQDGVSFLTGTSNSAVGLAIRDFVDESKTVTVIPTGGGAQALIDRGSPYIFNVGFTNAQADYAMGEWFYENIAKKNVMLIGPDYVGGAEHLGGFRAGFEAAGGEIAGEILTPFGTTQDFQPYLSQIRNAKPDAVYTWYAGAEAIGFVKQYEQFGLKGEIPLASSGALTDDLALKAMGDAAVGIPVSWHYSNMLDNPTNKAFVELVQQKLDKLPTFYTMHGWDSAQLIDLALQAVDGDASDPDALVEAIEGLGTIDSPRGDLELDKTHNPVQMFYLFEVEDVDGTLRNVPQEELGVFAHPTAAG